MAIQKLQPVGVVAFILIAKFLKKIEVPVRIPEVGMRKPKT